MKTTISKILNAKAPLEKLAAKDLPVKVSYRLAKLMQALNAEIRVYDEQRIKLCKKHGVLSDDGKKYDITDSETFLREVTELLELEVETDVKPVTLTPDICLTAQEIIYLEDFIEVSGLE